MITDGGDQPNVVPPTAAVWYYFRETTRRTSQALFALGDTMARAAAMMTSTQARRRRHPRLADGPGHFNKVIAEDMYENIKQVGMPTWSDADQTLARGIQRELGQKDPRGLVEPASATHARRRRRAPRTSAAAAATTSATCRGTCRR